MIKIVELNKTYHHANETIHAVRDVNLTVGDSEILCIFGRSGSGKTTLLNLIGTLDKPDSGTIEYAGVKLSEIKRSALPSFRRKNIGFVFQYFNLIPYLSALENVALPLKFDGVSRKERYERAKEILSRIGLSNRLDFTLAQLSGGQVQRVAFARALVARPMVVLADEPTGQLDSDTSKQITELIKTFREEYKTAFIIATHDEIISSIADRVLNMKDGSISGSARMG